MDRPNASLFASVFAGFASGAMSYAARGSGPGMSPQDFVTLAAQVGMAEVQLGKVALEKSADPQVLQFAQRMIADHGQANEELAGIATKEGLAVPTTPGPATTAARSCHSEMSKHCGAVWATTTPSVMSRSAILARM